MFVKTSLEIPYGLPAVRAELLASVQSWLQPLLEETQARSHALQTEVGLAYVSRQGTLHVDVEQCRVEERVVSIPFRVWLEGWEGQWPTFDSGLVAAWLGDRTTQLVLAGQYAPPALLGRSEQTLLHRVVEASSRDFLEGVAEELRQRLGPVED
jgi:hypothetical protein